jgi:hypothetical protein
MTTFTEMRTKVYDLTKRPELVALTDMAIRLATIRAHNVDFFPRDAASAVLTYTIPTTELFASIANIYTTVTDLRTPEYLQGEDTVSPYTPVELLDYVVSYRNFWTDDGELRSSVFTQQGTTFLGRFANATGRVKLFYYKNPNTTLGGYSSWIADTYPDELAMWAAGFVWARSGFQEMAKNSFELVQDFKNLLIESHLSSKK